MNLKKKIATTSSLRHQVNLQKNVLLKKNNIIKYLIRGIKFHNGRSSRTGSITTRHKGGGCKKNLHILSPPKDSYFSLCIAHMYNANQNAFLMLNFDLITKKFKKTISSINTFPGSIFLSSLSLSEYFIGYKAILQNIPIGTIVHSISSNYKSKYGTSAGSFCQLLEINKKCKLRLPSGLIVSIKKNFFATIGVTSNLKLNLTSVGKAGRSRLNNIRPSVRGIAMNPVDHPHGGKSNGGMPPVTPWGIPTRGKPTVKKSKYE